MFIHERGSFCRSLGYLLLVTTWIVAGSSGSEINETQEVTSLMDKLFDDNNACGTPAMELGFLVPGSYNEPQEENEITFRKALHFVKKMAQQIKLSDSGTHVGLVVYGKKPYMAFDFNEYFDLSSLSEAIEEVKTPVVGSKIGEALSFAKDQLYDKSARPEMPKALIVLMSKRSEDTIDHAVKALKTAGVKIYTVGIGGEGDPLEMSDMASDVQNTFVSDDSNLDSLVTKLVPKLCEAPEVGKAADNPDAPMNPHEEPGPGTSTISEPNAAQMPSAPQKPSAMIKEGPRANKVDLVFLVESSGKMGVANWRRTVLFMKYVADAFDISKTGTRVGLVVEGKTFHVVVDFNRIVKKPLLLAALGLIPLPFGDRKFGKALRDVKDLVINPSGRPNVPHVLIVLTDGTSVDGVAQPAKALMDSAVETFAVGLGKRVSLGQLEKIASFPTTKHAFHGDFKEVVKIASKVVAEIYSRHFCGGLNALLKKLLLRKTARKKKLNVHMPRKLATSHDAEENKGMEMEDSPPNADSFEDAMNDAPSHHFDIFDLLSNASGQANGTVGVSNQTTDMNSEEPETTPEEGAGVEEETVDAEESTSSTQNSSDNNSSMIAKKNTSSTSDKRVRLKDLANKICSAKADIGILIDGSSSVTQAKFAKLLDFTNSLVKSFSVSQDRTHIAVATASRGPHMSFDFRGFNDVPSITTAISRISYNGGPFLLGSSLTGVKTSWFKNSGRKSIPQLLLVLATSSSIDDIVAPSRVMRDRGVRIESVGIGTGFNGAQLKEMATHPARDHVMAVSKFDLLPMIRPLLTFRMCRAVGGKLISKPTSDQSQNEPPIVPNTQNTVDKQPVINSNKVQHLPKSNQVKQEKQINPDTQAQKNKLAATLKQLDQYKLIQKQSSSEESSQQQDDEIENEKIRKDIRLKLYSLLRRLGGTKKDIRAAYRSIIYNINGHHDSVNCKDTHSLCGQWAADNLCDKGNDTIDSQSVQRVCPKSCKVCY
ncbi:collagen alpha-6(VI) chain-like isoform X1 [Oculina patagonica]